MKFKLSYFILSLLPILSFFVNPKVYWGIHLLLLFVILTEEKVLVVTRAYRFLFYLGFPLLWTMFFSLGDEIGFIIQALFYLTTPLIFAFVGMQLSRVMSLNMMFRYIIYSGTIGALIYIFLSFYNFGFHVFLDPFEMREFFLWGSITNVITIILMLFANKYGLVFFGKIKRYTIFGINLMGLYFTASRTYYLLFIVFLFIFLYEKNKKIIFFISGIFMILFGVVFTSNSDNILINKIQSVNNETSMGDYDSEKDINSKYRGFESFMALKTYFSGTSMNLLLGYGFEKQVDLGVEVMLGDTKRSLLPVLHNGYLYLLIKEGFLGLVFYFIFFVKVIRLKSKDQILNFTSKIILGSALALILSNFVISSFFSYEMSILWVILGFFIVHIVKESELQIANKISGEI